MKYQYPPNYGADNLDYRVFNESREITSDIDRIITLDYGAFFKSKVTITNKDTGLSLVAGRDFKCIDLDFVATKRSGFEVCRKIKIITTSVKSLNISYMFVGGEHMSGLHLIKEMQRIYPDGIEPRYEWDFVSDKPVTFKPKEHNTHVKELYGLDGVAYSLDRMIAGVTRGHEVNQNNFMSIVMKKLDSMTSGLQNDLKDAEDNLKELFDVLSVQEGEYIFTDRLDNPAISRKYGNWVRVTNTILRGRNGKEVLTDDVGNVYSKSLRQSLRSCYIWQNIMSRTVVDYQLSFDNMISNNVYPLDTTITATLTAIGVADGTPVHYTIFDEATGRAATIADVYPKPRGSFVVNQGKATVQFKFNPKYGTKVPQRTYTLRLDNKNDDYGLLKVNEIDAKTAFPVFKSNIADIVLTSVDEGMTFKLVIDTQGYNTGDQMYLDWSNSSIQNSSFTEPLPTQLTVPDSKTVTISITLKSNLVNDGDRLLHVYVKESPDEEIVAHTPNTSIIINEVSDIAKARLTFRDVNNNTIDAMDEGSYAKIHILTELPNTELELQYSSSKPLTEFTGLSSSVTTDANGMCSLKFYAKEDFLTANGTQNLTVSVYYKNNEIGRNNLFIHDTSKSPEYVAYFTKTLGGNDIEGIGEGEEFYFNVRVADWAAPTTAPVLNFLYTFDDNGATTKDYLLSRLESTFYPAMAFDESAAIYNEVYWNNGTLSFKMKVIENKSVDGLTTFNISVKQDNQLSYNIKADLKIYDTSIYNVTGTWSSSPTVLTPITSANEMQTNGLNNLVYLFIDAEGDGSLMGDVTLNIEYEAGVDPNGTFATVFPNKVKFDAGATRKIVTVSIKADFMEDGDVNINVVGSYIPKGSTTPNVVFKSPLTIIDNSFKTPIECVLLQNQTDTAAPADLKFSEWLTLYPKFTFIPYAFESYVLWEITDTTGTKGDLAFVAKTGRVDIASSASTGMGEIVPIRDRAVNGERNFRVTFTRYRKSDNQPISTTERTVSHILKDDALPATLKIGYYASTTSTTELTSLDEGKTYYLRATVTDPDYDCQLWLQPKYSTVKEQVVGSVTVIGRETTPDLVQYPIDEVVYNMLRSEDHAVHTINIPVLIKADRKTNTTQKALDIRVSIIPRNVDWAVGDPIPADYLNGGNLITTKQMLINDTSKTATYTGSFSASAVDEGEDFTYSLNIKDGTIGDIFYPEVMSGSIALDRLEVSGLGVEKIALKLNDTLTWDFRVKKNRKDDGVGKLMVRAVNASYAQKVGDAEITVNDTSRTPVFGVYRTTEASPYVGISTAINEGDSTARLMVLTDPSIPIDEDFKIEWVSGKPASEFPADTFSDHVTTDIKKADGTFLGQGFVIPFYPKYDRKTNTAEENKVTVRVTTLLSGISVLKTFDLADTSQNLKVLEAYWGDSTGATIGNITEGKEARLYVKVNGGAETIGITCKNNGGRSPSRLAANSGYDVTLNRTSNDEWIYWAFRPLEDGITNVGNETKLAVTLTADSGELLHTTELPIVDSYLDTLYGCVVYVKGDSTKTPVKFIKENTEYEMVGTVTYPGEQVVTGMSYNNNTYYHANKTTVNSSGTNSTVVSESVALPAYVYAPVSFILTSSETTAANILWYSVIFTRDGVESARFTYPVLDTGVNQIAGRITTVEDINTKILKAVAGNTVAFVIDPTDLASVDWNFADNHVVRWKLVNATTGVVIPNPNASNSNVTFNKSNLSSFNGGDGYLVNIPLTTSVPAGNIKIVFYEEYTYYGESVSFKIGETNVVEVVTGSTAPAITNVYYARDQAGTIVTTTEREGEHFYLIVKTVNVPLGTDITLDWTGSTTNSDDFVVGNTDVPAVVKLTSYNSADNTGLAYYKFESLFDGKPDFGKDVTSAVLVTDSNNLSSLVGEVSADQQLYLVVTTLGLRVGDKFNVTLNSEIVDPYFLNLNGENRSNGYTYAASVTSVDSTTMVGKTVIPVKVSK